MVNRPRRRTAEGFVGHRALERTPRVIRTLHALLVLGTVTGLMALAAAAQGAPIREFTAGLSASDEPHDIALGSDGNLWFTEHGSDRIGRITPAGVISHFASGITSGAGPWKIVPGPGGALWFTERDGERLGKITTAGVVTEYDIAADADGWLDDVVAGPDGNLWVTTYADRVLKVTPSGAAIAYPTTGGMVEGSSITVGPDDAMWFTLASSSGASTGRVGRITTGGQLSEVTTGITPGASRGAIAAGPDGNIWSTGYGRVAKITMGGAVTEYPLPFADYVRDITAGPDGGLWLTREDFVGDHGGEIDRVTTAGTVTRITCGLTPDAGLGGITSGLGGDGLWITATAGRIINTGTQPTCPLKNIARPRITVTEAKPGDVLACEVGQWSAAPSSYTYRWLRDGTPIADARSTTYTVQIADVGYQLVCEVTALAPGESATAASDPVPISAPGSAPSPDPVAPALPVAPNVLSPPGPALPPAPSVSTKTVQTALDALLGATPRTKTALQKFVSTGRYSAPFRAPAAGTLKIVWQTTGSDAQLARVMTIATGSRIFSEAGAAIITVRLSSRGKGVLGRSARRLKITVSFVSGSGSSTKRTRWLVVHGRVR
jgi:streptogramin lyase